MSTNAGLLALKRFGMGPRPGDLDAAASDTLGIFISDLAMAAGGTMPVGADLPDSATSLSLMSEDLERPAATDTARSGATSDAAARPEALSQRESLFRSEVQARVRAGVTASPGFTERLTLFWSNHFAVSAAKGGRLKVLAGPFEREAIRPHILGRFSDMLQAAVLHQAMLTYLDNNASFGPNSPAGRNRDRGYNENLAREVLELHTIGVEGGQTQDDVKALSLVLTGWSVLGPTAKNGPPGTVFFNNNRHEPGDFTLLGKLYPDGGGEQAHAALLDLARQPATARFIAGKLARHFVSDDAPASLIDRLTVTFAETDGDLAAVSAALLDSPEAWDPQYRKLRSPYEFLIAAFRLCTIDSPQIGLILTSLRGMGQPIWAPPGPDGFPDDDVHWGSGEGIRARLDVAVKIAERSRAEPDVMIDEAFGEDVSGDTRGTIVRAGDRRQAVALLLMSPEFQWR